MNAAGVLGNTSLLWRGLVDLVLPESCISCGRWPVTAHGTCSVCSARLLSMLSLPYCMRCGSTLGPGVAIREEGCWACPNPLPRFWRVVRLGPYSAPLRRGVQQMKYRGRNTARQLGPLLGRAVAGVLGDRRLDVVLPVPMHWRRRFARGYDHARLLAGIVAKDLGVSLGHELSRVRHTPPQVRLSRTRRLENVRGAFAVTDAAGIAGANVLLVDDVTTTGATANEAARKLLSAGANSVLLAVLAKAERRAAYSQWAT